MESMGVNAFLQEHFKGKKIFITGHTGFKGTWLVMLLHYCGANIKGFALAPDANSLYSSINGDELCTSIIGDIRDYEKLKQEIITYKPHYIFHMAAQAFVLESYMNPLETFQTNAIGTLNVLESLRDLKHKCSAVIVTTDKVYEQKKDRKAFIEGDSLGGHDPYSASKACCELMVQSYCKSYFENAQIKLTSARAGNVIGGGDWSENRIVPDIIRSIQNKEILNIRNPLSVRPWQHVLDVITGYLMLAAKSSDDLYKKSISWNFAPLKKEDITVQNLVEIMLNIFQQGKYKVIPPKEEYHEAEYLQLDASLAHHNLDWTPKFTPKQAIEFTATWYKTYLQDKLLTKSITQKQIEHYLTLQ
jgi:CDP-glucose 4,6-dehydratase